MQGKAGGAGLRARRMPEGGCSPISQSRRPQRASLAQPAAWSGAAARGTANSGQTPRQEMQPTVHTLAVCVWPARAHGGC
eukprot:6336589-Prymnesium_polylepis.1